MTPAEVGKQKAVRGRRSWARRLAWFGGTLILVLIVIVAGALILVSNGPVELSVVRSTAERTIAKHLAGNADVRVGSGRIAFEGSYDPIVILEDIEIADPGGAYSGRANRLVLSVPLDSALSGDFRPNIADGDGLAIRLAMPAAGAAAGGDGGTSSLVGQAQLESLHRHVADIAIMADDLGMERITLTNAQVEITDTSASNPATWHVADLDGEMRVDQAGALSLSLSGSGRSGRWSAAITRTDRDGGGTALSITASDLTWTDLVSEERQAGMSQIPKIPVYPQLEAEFSENGDLLTAQLLMTLGAGYVGLGRQDTVLLDEATIRVEWDSDKRHFVFHPSAFRLGETVLNIGGFVSPPKALDGPWGIFFGIRDAQFRPKDVEGPPIIVNWLVFKGAYAPQDRRLRIDQLEVAAGTSRFAAGGTVDITDDGPIVALAANFGPVSVAALKRLWPVIFAPKTRRWIVNNVRAGTVTRGRLDMALGPDNFDGDPKTFGWPDDALSLSFDFENAESATFGGLPLVTEAHGRGRITKGRFILEVDKGRLKTRTGRSVAIESGSFSIPDVRPPDMDGVVDITVDGPVRSMGEIISAEPINAFKSSAIQVKHISGDINAHIHASFPLEKRLPFEAIDWVARAEIKNFASAQPIDGRTISKGRLALNADSEEVVIRGTATMDGIATKLDMVEPLRGSGSGSRAVRLVLDDRGRKKAGLDFGTLLTGPIGVAVTQSDGKAPQDYDVDLTRSRLVIPIFGWTKGAGVPGKAAFKLVGKGKTRQVDNLVISSEGLRASGRAQVSAGGRLLAINLDKFRLRRSDKAKLSVKFARDRSMTIAFDAQTFDGRSLIRNLKSGKASEPGEDTNKPIVVKARIDRLTGFNGVAIRKVVANAQIRKGAVTKLTLTGTSDRGRPIKATIEKQGRGRQLVVTAADTGSLLKFLDAYDRMVGGSAVVSARLRPNGTIRGAAVVKRFQISEDPTLTELIKTSASQLDRRPERLNVASNLPGTSRSSFDKLEIQFIHSGDAIAITDSRLKSPFVGINAHGKVDLKRSRMALSGTFLPAYGINNLFGKIPLLGQALGAGSEGGLLGVTFKLAGAIDKPVLNINPVSAIAPGIFRKIFEYQ